MFNMVTYILTFVIIAFVLISAVILHLRLFHIHVVLNGKEVKFDGRTSPTLHEMIFDSPP